MRHLRPRGSELGRDGAWIRALGSSVQGSSSVGFGGGSALLHPVLGDVLFHDLVGAIQMCADTELLRREVSGDRNRIPGYVGREAS